MGVLSLVLGILGLVVFDWLGMTIGSGMVAASSIQSAVTGNGEFSAGPIWGWGIGLGVIIPLIAVVAGVVAIKSGKKKGVGIAGLICGAIAAVIGLVLTFTAASAAEEIAKVQVGGDMGNALDSLNDPAAQEALKKAVEGAMKQQ